jgi:hypothetical protein
MLGVAAAGNRADALAHKQITRLDTAAAELLCSALLPCSSTAAYCCTAVLLLQTYYAGYYAGEQLMFATCSCGATMLGKAIAVHALYCCALWADVVRHRKPNTLSVAWAMKLHAWRF